MADASPVGDQPRSTGQQLKDSGRDPSFSYRTKAIKSVNPRQMRRDPSRG